jgi:ribosomal protein S18 acetylase RimI-like enzyme
VVDPRPDEPRANAPEVVTAAPADAAALADSLADAFFDDPVMSWILTDEANRRRRLAHYLPRATVWTTPDRSAAALWSPPGQAIMAPTTILRYLPDLVGALGRHTLRALRTLNHVERQHPKERHWYLGVLGTRTAAQGKGLGSAVLGPVLARCDSEGLPAYLESSKYSNIAFYRRHGFEVTGEIALPFGGPSVWPMWRDPRPR